MTTKTYGWIASLTARPDLVPGWSWRHRERLTQASIEEFWLRNRMALRTRFGTVHDATTAATQQGLNQTTTDRHAEGFDGHGGNRHQD